jgi:CAAX protease family protein
MAGGDDDRFAEALRGFGPTGIAAIVIILAGNFAFAGLSAILVLVWIGMSRTPWEDVGFRQPRSWPVTIAAGIAFGTLFKLLMKAVVMPLLGAPAINRAYHYIAGNTAAMLFTAAMVIVIAGFGEELVFRGYSFERLRRLLGPSAAATVAIVLITSMWFGALHYKEQGLAGVEQAAIVGLVYGSIYAKTREIWLLMIAHAAFDVAAVLIIYWNAESGVAHLIFK